MEKWFNVGKIVNTHGLKGEVRVISKTDFADERYEPGKRLTLFMPNSNERLELIIETHRVHKSFDLLTFKGYGNVNDVEKMKGGILKIDENQLSLLEEDEYYFHEIIGCEVQTIEGEVLGKVTEILTPGANDVWVVKGTSKKELLIPYIEQVVKRVDVQSKLVIIDPLDGLLS